MANDVRGNGRTMVGQFRAAVVAAVPLIAVETFDPEACVARIQADLAGSEDGKPMVQAMVGWDCVTGCYGVNDEGRRLIAAMDLANYVNPVDVLRKAADFPGDTLLFMVNAHREVWGTDKESAQFVQAFWNLRGTYKAEGSAAVLLGPSFSLPAELANDVLLISEDLPSDDEVRDLVVQGAANAEFQLTEEVLDGAVAAMRGLTPFTVDQAVALSLTRSGLDQDYLWEHKRRMIASNDGLSVWRGGQRFEDIFGLEELKRYHRLMIQGRDPFQAVVWIDEGEKDMAGVGGDNTGSSQDQLKVMLTEMQDREYTGSIFVGVPGAAKSAFAKAIANEAGVLCIRLDLGGMKAKHLGESERKVRQAMKVVEAVGGHAGAYFVMTSNDVGSIKPELKRRFTEGIWFFDLPDSAQRAGIWDLYLRKYKMEVPTMDGRPHGVDDEGWSGAEIENCVKRSYRLRITVQDAARTIIPVSVSGRELVDTLRSEADLKYSSTERPGAYRKDEAKGRPQGRKIRT